MHRSKHQIFQPPGELQLIERQTNYSNVGSSDGYPNYPQKRIILMSDKSLKPQPRRTPTPIDEVPGAITSWDYTHSEIVDTPLVIMSYVEIETQYGEAFVTECIIKDEVVQVLMGGLVLMQQLTVCKDAFPVTAMVTRPGKYYILN